MVRIPNFIHNTDIGQNFLIDRSIVDFMIGRAKLTPEDKVLEIGPGEGILTEGLLSTECSGVCTVELDTRLKHTIDMLAIKDSRLHPLWGDAVQFDYERELSKRDTGSTLYILDEPTTGLHFADIEKLLSVLFELVERGNTVVVIEHNMDVIKCADAVIDLGPEGGDRGGQIVAQGTPEEVAAVESSHTGRFLKKYLEATGATGGTRGDPPLRRAGSARFRGR